MPPDATLGAFQITTRYETDLAVVRLVGPVTVPSILALCDEIDLALGYYQYAQLDIELDSPGGDVAALDYLITRWSAWRARPAVRIGTLALTQAASAAGVILSLGDVGRRRAYPAAALQYHYSRTMLPQAYFTGADLAVRERMLHQIDVRLLRLLASHVWTGVAAGLIEAPPKTLAWLPDVADAYVTVPTMSDATRSDPPATKVANCEDLATVYAQLNALDTVITPDAARRLGLIDIVLA